MKFKKLLTSIVAAGMTCGLASALEPGDTAPEFKLPSAEGDEVSLADYKGKVVVLEWTNYGCPFVKKHYHDSGNMPSLQEKYKAKDVVWLVINSAHEGHGTYLNPEAFVAGAEKAGSKATAHLIDASGTVGTAYGAKTTPHMYVIDKEGKLAYMGGIDDKSSTKAADIEGATNYVSAALDAVLAGKEVATPKAKPYGCSVKYADK